MREREENKIKLEFRERGSPYQCRSSDSSGIKSKSSDYSEIRLGGFLVKVCLLSSKERNILSFFIEL